MTAAEFGRAMLCAFNEETAPMIGVVVGAALGFCLSLLRPLDRSGDRFRFVLCLAAGVGVAVGARAFSVGAC